MKTRKILGITLILLAVGAASVFAASWTLRGTYTQDRTGSTLYLSGDYKTQCTLDMGDAGSASGVYSIVNNSLIMSFTSGFMRGTTATWTIVDNDTIIPDGRNASFAFVRE